MTKPPARDRFFLNHPAVFLLAVLFAWAVLGASTWAKIKQNHGVSKVDLQGAELPQVDFNSPTGYALGQRRLILQDVDSCQWIMHTQRMVAEGGWRERFAPDDNAPQGREIHWSSGVMWWLAGLGSLHARFLHLPVGAGIEQASLWSNVLFLGLALLLVPWVVRRAFGWLASALGAVAFVTSYSFGSQFASGCVDHHGWVSLAGLIFLLFLAAGGGGWVAGDGTAPSPAQARKWFAASGFFAAVGLWISAATIIPFIVGMGLAAIVTAFLLAPAPKPSAERVDPSLWRLWGNTAALCSLGFYLLEYFPDHFGWRLEVNHPCYALALWGGGEWLSRVVGWRAGGPFFSGASDRWRALAATVAMLLTPLALLAFKTQVFRVSDPFLWQLHHDYISEFLPLTIKFSREPFLLLVMLLGALPLLIFADARLLRGVPLAMGRKAGLALTLGGALLPSFLGLSQSRWYNVASGPWLAVLIATVGCCTLLAHTAQYDWWEKMLGFLFVIFVVFYLPVFVFLDVRDTMRKPPDIGIGGDKMILIRDLAYRLRRTEPTVAAPDQPPIVASGPTNTTWLMYFGGLRGLGTLYWENLEGLKRAAELFSAPTSREGERLLRENHVSYIVITSGEPFVFEYPRLWRRLAAKDHPQDTLAYGLASGKNIPLWASPLPYPIPNRQKEGTLWMALYDVREAR